MSIVIVSCMYIISLYHNMNSFVSVFINRMIAMINITLSKQRILSLINLG